MPTLINNRWRLRRRQQRLCPPGVLGSQRTEVKNRVGRKPDSQVHTG